MPTVKKVQLDRTVGEALGIESKETEILGRINKLVTDMALDLNKKMAELGATVADEHGPIIPQPESDRDKIMFMAGQVSLASFMIGATLGYGKHE